MKVLLAEGEPELRRELRKAFRKGGHKVISVLDGDSAWRAFEAKGPFDCALLDVTMPGMGGVLFLEHVASREGEVARVACLLMTRNLSSELHLRVRELGGDILRKPLDLGTVLARLIGPDGQAYDGRIQR